MSKQEKLITKAAVKQVLSAYLKQYKKYPFWTGIAFLCPALGTIGVFYIPPLVVSKLVDAYVASGGLTVQQGTYYFVLFGVSWLAGEALWRLGMHALIKIETHGLRELSLDAFRRLVVRDYDFYSNNFVGTLTKKTISFARSFEGVTDVMSFNILNNVLPILFAVIVLGSYSLWLPAILLCLLAIAVSIGVPIVRRRAKLVAERHEANSKAAGYLSDAVSNILAVKSFAKEDNESRLFDVYSTDAANKFKRAADYQNLRFEVTLSPIYVLTNVMGLVAAVYFTNMLGLAAGTIVVVFSYYARTSGVLWDINRIYRNLESSISEAAEFTQMLIEPPKVQDAINATALQVSNATVVFSAAQFKYGGQDASRDMFLNDFNLSIPHNQKVGLVGPSGGGKTTITKLLLRFVDLNSGSITIDGQDIKTITQKSLRDAISYVPQEPLLFHRSLHENIAYGNEHATEEEVIQAATLARAHDFIMQLPQGYKTLVGERGVKLSGGQRQRIAIARAILKRSSILILDEATSSLDSESEKYIQEGLVELMKDKTALVIAHRLSTIKHLDRIIVLAEGKIVQDGTHDELIKEKGLYATLWSHQSGEFLE